MDVKTFEIRDRKTFIPALAVRLSPTCEADRYLLARTNYGRTPVEQAEYIVLWRLNGGAAVWAPSGWGDSRTMGAAHKYIIRHWDGLESGVVIDVEYILGETKAPKESEASANGAHEKAEEKENV